MSRRPLVPIDDDVNAMHAIVQALTGMIAILMVNMGKHIVSFWVRVQHRLLAGRPGEQK